MSAPRWNDANYSDYEAETRARGQREQPERVDLVNDLPEFRHQPAAERAPTIPAPPTPTATERAEAKAREDSQESRMSIAQLRDCIGGMEATTRMKAADAAHQLDRTAYSAGGKRPEKPSERIARADKLTRYRAELARREAEPRATPSAILTDRAHNARLEAARLEATAHAYVAAEGSPAHVDPADLPALVVCGLCGLLVAQDEDGDMQSHINRQQIECPALPTNWARHRTAKRDPTAQAPHQLVRCSAPGCASIATEAITSARPHCGYPAHAPGALDAEARQRAAVAAAHVASAAELPPVPPAAAAEISTATARRVAVVATARAETLSALDAAVEALVRTHSSGAVIDAAWSAGKRIFRPAGAR